MTEQDDLKPQNEFENAALTDDETADDDPDAVGMTLATPEDAEPEDAEEAVGEEEVDSTDEEPPIEAYTLGKQRENAEGPLDSDLDIDAALASVASLSDVIAEREAIEAARIAEQERAAEEDERRRAEHYFPHPPMKTLRRGQLASVVPALVLIAIGVWLTFTLTAPETSAPPLGTISLVALAGLGLTFLSLWLSTERWSRGALFGGAALLLVGAVIIYLTQSETIGGGGWPLIVAAVGAAMVLSGFLARPTDRRLGLAGLVVIVAGGASLVVTTGVLSAELIDTIETVGPVALPVALLLLLVPTLLRRRG